MPFASKRQQRAMFGGHIPGMDKEDAKQWAHETPDIKKLPDRAPAEKGKPTLRSKKADTENYLDKKERDRTRRGTKATIRGKTASMIISEMADFTPQLEDLLTKVFAKTAVLGSAVMNPNNVGKLRGVMTSNAMKAPGYAASTQAMNPGKNVISAMNKAKPH